jgi:CrcB protein
LDRYLVVVAGAGVGGLLRYLLGTWTLARYAGPFPLGTFAVNVTGSFAIGVLMTIFVDRIEPHPLWRLFLVTGVLGGYTTFSSFEYEAYQTFTHGARGLALVYVLGSVATGYLALWLGAVLARR